MTSIHCAPLLAAILLLIPAAYAQSVPTASAGQFILDQPLVGDVALPSLGGQLTNGVDMAFATSGDKAPRTLNTGAITIGFTTATALPIGGQVIISVPKGYFTAVDSTKVHTFTGTTTTCTCVGAAGTTVDTLTCATAGAILAVGAATLSFATGTLTTGAPTAAGTYNVQTTVDRAMASMPATQAIGGVISSPQTIVFTTAADQVPGTVITGTVKVTFTVVTSIPIGGFVTLTLPKNYFSAVSSSSINLFETTKATAACVLTKATGTGTTDSVVCTIAGAAVAAGAQTLIFVAGAVTTGGPAAASTYTVTSSTDRVSATAATAALGSQLTTKVDVAFSTSGNRVPGTINNGTVTLGFTAVTAVPIGGTITIALPPKYFSAVDSSKANTLTGGGTATCMLTAGATGTAVLGVTSADTLVCTVAGTAVAAAAITLTFIAGAVTTGSPQAAGTFNVATSTDIQMAAAGATVALGGQLTNKVDVAFFTVGDRIPGTLNTGNVTFGFTTVTAVPVNGKITIALPPKYLSSVVSTKANTLTGGGTATCVLTAGVKGTAVLGVTDADTVVCTVAGTGLAAATAITFAFITGTVTTGAAQAAATFNVATSTDIQMAAAGATVALGGALSTGVAMAFATATNTNPFTLSTGTVTVGFTTGTNITAGGKITISVPRGYFSKVDESKTNTLTTTNSVCTCALTQAIEVATQDTIVCTVSGATAVAGAQTLTFIAGAVTTGAATAVGTFDVVSSVDTAVTGTANVALGATLTTVVSLAFTNADDRVPGKFATSNNTVTLGFTVVTPIPIGGKITLTFPQGYFSKVDATKDNTVGTSATAKCSLANVAQTQVPATISPATTTVGAQSTLTVSIIPSIVTGVTQVAIPLTAGFSLDTSSVAACSANCASTTAGKVTAVIANSVLTLTFASDNSITLKNTLTTFTVTLVTNPSVAGYTTTGITAVAFNPSTTVVCTTAGAIVTAAAQTFTFVTGSVTIGTGQKAGTFQVETSTDLPLATRGVTLSLGGGVTVGKPLAFSNAQDQIPGRVNSGPISLGATLANSVPIGGQFLLSFPSNYFTNVNPTSVVTLTKGARRSLLQTSTLSCVRTAGTPNDQITCTLSGAASGTGAVVLTFPAGSLTTGLPASGGGFNLATANPPAGVTRIPYFPKASSSAYGVAWLLVAVSALLAFF